MNYRYETIMSWIMYVRNGIWNVEKRNDYADNPEFIKRKYEELFKNEIVRECNDAYHFMGDPHQHIGTISVFIDPVERYYKVIDNYNSLLAFYNGIYGIFDGKRLCLDTHGHGLHNEYFKFCENDDDRYISLYSIVASKTASNSQNVRRMISILFSRYFRYLESLNPEDAIFLDYTEKEKEKIKRECLVYDGKEINKKKSKTENDE